MLDLIAGPSYEDVYLIGRVLLTDRAEHQELFLVNFSRNLVSFRHGCFIQTWIAYIHSPDSSKKDDYLTTIRVHLLSSVTL
jgi:hypothetical protein